MAESNDVQALQSISNEIDKSQIKIIFSNQCLKAQAFLFDKLKKESERQKEICNFMRSSNLNLETEIQLAEQQIISLHLAIESIKYGNIELKKELLLSKERKAEIFERIQNGKEKYENLWQTSKIRYESIPYVRELIEVKNKSNITQANINALICEAKHLMNNIEIRKNELLDADSKHVVELANFFVHERPKLILSINDKRVKIMEISKEIEILVPEHENKNHCDLLDQSTNKHHSLQVEDNCSNLNMHIDKDSLALPKLHLQDNYLDILSVKLDQIKKVDSQNVSSMKRAGSFTSTELDKKSPKKSKTEEKLSNCYISSYFNIGINIYYGNDDEKLQSKKYSDKKLIHILQDIKLDKNDTFDIIKKLEPNQFQENKYITPKVVVPHLDEAAKFQDKTNNCLEIAEIEEIDLTTKTHKQVVAPSSQFLDVSQNTQEKKTVTFNINEDKIAVVEEQNVDEMEIDKSEEKIFNVSTTSQESYAVIKDEILKKRKLDLSPQFVYGKNSLIQMQSEDKIVASSFFETKGQIDLQMDGNENDNNKKTTQDQLIIHDENEPKQNTEENDTNVVVSSPKQRINNLEVPVAGFLFNHGPRGISESLNVSLSTTGFEDSEDFPHCLDSSILLSPNGDIPTTVPSSGNNELGSQGVSNFLAGFRKTGLSFFGCATTSDSKPDSSAQNQINAFNFTFGNEEKKARGGFFNMFH